MNDNLQSLGERNLINTDRLLFAMFASDQDFSDNCVTLRFDNDHELRITMPAGMTLRDLFSPPEPDRSTEHAR